MTDTVLDTVAIADMGLDMVVMEDMAVDTAVDTVDMAVVTVGMVVGTEDMAVGTEGMVVVMADMEACKEVDTVGCMDAGRTDLEAQRPGLAMATEAHRAACLVQGMDPQEIHRDRLVLQVCTIQPCAVCILSSIFLDGLPTLWTKTP